MRRDDDGTGTGDDDSVGDVPTLLGGPDESRMGATIAAEPGVRPAATSGAGDIERGTVVGRYVVLSRLGAGAMGVVYAAYDPELDRKVALKLLQAAVGLGTAASLGRTRLLREAQALARLSHPHVVAIHDVGTLADRVWLAMEYIDGVTLGGWVAEHEPRWAEVLGVLRRVGEGLAAAHAVGLVHRDLKPDNIMVGRDGRVRVMDFGLARAAGQSDPAPAPDALVISATRLAALKLPVTQVGAVMGTPAYMAPEQWRGEEADARADQFSFCVTLWEALYGMRPFAGDTATNLVAAVLGGELQAPPRGRRVPSWLRKVLTRGLQTEPEQRFPTMDALLGALARGESRKRRRRLALAAGALVAALVAVPASMHVQRNAAIAGCTAAGGEIAEVWNDEARANLERALLASGKSYAATTYAKATPWIDRWSHAWAETRTQVCLEAEVDGTRTPELFEAAVACLGERREELAALLAVLIEDPGPAATRAVPAFAGLTPPSSCTDRAALERRPPLPADDETRALVAALRRDATRVQSMYAAGRWADGLVDAEALLVRAEAVDHAPLIVLTSELVGFLANKNYKLDLAERALTRAFVEGAAIGLDELAAESASELVYVTGYAQARFEAGVQWSHAGEAEVRRLGKADDMLGARLYNALAITHKIHGDYAEAARLYGRVLEIRERVLGPDHPEVGMLLGNLANLVNARGDPDGTVLGMYRRSLKILEEGLGEDHPHVANALNNYGAVLVERGEYAQALPLHRRALAIREAAFGPNHAEVASTLANLALILVERNDLAGAQALGDRVLAIREQVFPPDHPDIADALTNQANVRLRQGAMNDALALEQRALAIRERNQGPEHPDVAYSLHNLGQIQLDLGAFAAAEQLFVRALAIREKTFAPDSREVAKSVAALGTYYVQRGDAVRAAPLLERALPLYEKLYGKDDLEVATTIVAVGDLQLLRREFAAAQASYTRAQAIWTRQYGADSPKACPARIGLGELALAEGRPDEAIARLEPLEPLCTIAGTPRYIREILGRARRARGGHGKTQ